MNRKSIGLRTSLLSLCVIPLLVTSPAMAATHHVSTHFVKITSSQSREASLISHLKSTVTVLDKLLNNYSLSSTMYSNCISALTNIMLYVEKGSGFSDIAGLKEVLNLTGNMLQTVPATQNPDILSGRGDALFAYDNVNNMANNLQAGGTHLGTISIVLNGKKIDAHAQTLRDHNEIFVNITNAEYLIKAITGDKIGPLVFNNNTGMYNIAQQFKGDTWNIQWQHTLPRYATFSRGNTHLQIQGSTVVDCNSILRVVGGKKEVFIPIWAVQNVIDQMVYITPTQDYFANAQWVVNFNPNQYYDVNGVEGRYNSVFNNTRGVNWAFVNQGGGTFVPKIIDSPSAKASGFFS